MWFSIESRVPFLDHRLVERILKSPAAAKIKNGNTKAILRQGMAGILPSEIMKRRDKVGFDTPADEWFRTIKFSNAVKTIINEGFFFNQGIIDKKSAQKIHNLHISGRKNISKEIWKWINLEKWYRSFIEK